MRINDEVKCEDQSTLIKEKITYNDQALSDKDLQQHN